MKRSSLTAFLGTPAASIVAVLAFGTNAVTGQVAPYHPAVSPGAFAGGTAAGTIIHSHPGNGIGFAQRYDSNRMDGTRPGYGRGYRDNRYSYGYPFTYSIWIPDYFGSIDQQSQYNPAPYPYSAGSYPPASLPSEAPAPAPQPVVINQYFAGPPPGAQSPDMSDAGSSSPFNGAARGAAIEEVQTYYLIAFKDHSIFAARAYSVDDNTLNYVTMQNSHKQAPVDTIDMDLTKKLNEDRGVSLSLSSGR